MSGTNDHLLLTGRLLVEAGIVTEERLEATLRNQAGHRAAKWPGKPLGHHLVVESVISRPALEALLRRRDSIVPTDEARIGEIAVRNGFITEAQLAGCLREQEIARQAGKAPDRLGRLILAKRLMTEHRLQAVLDRQKALAPKTSSPA